jgi:hypothetical protein
MPNTVDRINSRSDIANEKIGGLENTAIETIQNAMQREEII